MGLRILCWIISLCVFLKMKKQLCVNNLHLSLTGPFFLPDTFTPQQIITRTRRELKGSKHGNYLFIHYFNSDPKRQRLTDSIKGLIFYISLAFYLIP